MNILLFLTPKRDVAYLFDDFTIRQALEKMEYHRYTSIPIINRKGIYIGTLTEGDILWYIKNNFNLNIHLAENEKMINIPRKQDNQAVTATTDINSVFSMAMKQNFIPVIDDNGTFIGIITRRNIFNYFFNKTNLE